MEEGTTKDITSNAIVHLSNHETHVYAQTVTKSIAHRRVGYSSPQPANNPAGTAYIIFPVYPALPSPVAPGLGLNAFFLSAAVFAGLATLASSSSNLRLQFERASLKPVS